MGDVGAERLARKKAKKQRKKEERKAQAEALEREQGAGKKRKRSAVDTTQEEEEDIQINIGSGKRDRSKSKLRKKEESAPSNESTSKKERKRKSKEASALSPSASAKSSSSENTPRIVWSLPEPRPVLSVKELREFLMHGLGVGSAPTWACLSEKTKVKQAVVLIVDSIGYGSYKRNKADFPFLAALDKHSAPVRSPGSKYEVFPVIAELLTCPPAQKASQSNKKKPQKQQQPSPCKPRSEWVMQPSDIVLTRSELAENKFPGFSEEWTPEVMANFVKTKKAGDKQGAADRMVAMDCEMCLTEQGQELTRISLVNVDGNVLYDQFVMPKNPIIDYKTKWSGVTEELLKGVKTSVEDVQKKLLSIIDSSTILVGHSLENDLKACRVQHANVIDTSVLYPHAKGSPYKNGLNFLMTKFLRKSLDRKDGHCSVDDANATLELVKLKLSRGPTFGLMGDNSLEGESLFRVVERGDEPCRSTLVVERGAGGGKELVGGSKATVITCAGNEAIEEAVRREVREAGEEAGKRLLIARFSDCEGVEGGGEDDGAKKNKGAAARWEKEMDGRVERVCKELPRGCLVMVVGSSESLSEISEMRSRRRASNAGKTAGLPWADKDEKQLMAKVEAARTGLGVFFFSS